MKLNTDWNTSLMGVNLNITGVGLNMNPEIPNTMEVIEHPEMVLAALLNLNPFIKREVLGFSEPSCRLCAKALSNQGMWAFSPPCDMRINSALLPKDECSKSYREEIFMALHRSMPAINCVLRSRKVYF